MPDRLFWRFYWSDSFRLAGYHCANTDKYWIQIFGRLMWLREKGHKFLKVTASHRHLTTGGSND